MLGFHMGLGPDDVDRMKCKDFFQLILDCDAYNEAQRKANEG